MIRKFEKKLTVTLLALCLSSCSQMTEQSVYHLSGTVWQDSLIDDQVYLYEDIHQEILEHVIPVSKGSFSYQGNTSTVSELSLAFQDKVVNVYVSPGAEISLQIDSLGYITWNTTDSINAWMAQQVRVLADMNSAESRHYVDSVCHENANQIRSMILLYNQMEKLNDSLFVRRCLGSLSENIKPAWLVDAMDNQFDLLSKRKNRSDRLPREELRLSNDSIYALLNSRQESLLIFFWADYDSASIDSLSLLKNIARDYGLYDFEKGFESEKSPTRSKKMHRVELMTVCIHAADSSSWRNTIDTIPGKHVWLTGAFAHPLLSNFKINSLPANLQSDRFGNYQSSNKWGKSLRNWLENTPNKTISKAADKPSTSQPKKH